MSDILERLRDGWMDPIMGRFRTTPIEMEAADEIERLRAEVGHLRQQLGMPLETERENERLRAEVEALRKDAERLEWLIQNAWSGPNDDMREPLAVGLVIGEKIEWPDGVRGAIDAALVDK